MKRSETSLNLGAVAAIFWVDAGLAYCALPEAVKARLENAFVTHDFRRAGDSGEHLVRRFFA